MSRSNVNPMLIRMPMMRSGCCCCALPLLTSMLGLMGLASFFSLAFFRRSRQR